MSDKVKVVGDKITFNFYDLEDGVFYKVEYKGDTYLIGREGDEIVIYSAIPLKNVISGVSALLGMIMGGAAGLYLLGSIVGLGLGVLLGGAIGIVIGRLLEWRFSR